MSRVAAFSSPYLRGLSGLGQDVYDPVTGDYVASLSPADNPEVSVAPTLGPASGGGFTIPTGAPISAAVLQNSPFANPNTVMTAAQNPNQSQIAQALTPISSSLVSSLLSPSSVKVGPSPTVAVPLSTSSIGLALSSNPGIVILSVVIVGAALLFGGKRR